MIRVINQGRGRGAKGAVSGVELPARQQWVSTQQLGEGEGPARASVSVRGFPGLALPLTAHNRPPHQPLKIPVQVGKETRFVWHFACQQWELKLSDGVTRKKVFQFPVFQSGKPSDFVSDSQTSCCRRRTKTARQQRQKARRLVSCSFRKSFGRTIKPRSLSGRRKKTIKKTFLIQSIFWKEDANFPIHVGEVADCASRPSAPDPLFSFLKPFYRKTK